MNDVAVISDVGGSYTPSHTRWWIRSCNNNLFEIVFGAASGSVANIFISGFESLDFTTHPFNQSCVFFLTEC
jgi:hypothetical protein